MSEGVADSQTENGREGNREEMTQNTKQGRYQSTLIPLSIHYLPCFSFGRQAYIHTSIRWARTHTLIVSVLHLIIVCMHSTVQYIPSILLLECMCERAKMLS